MSPVRGDWADRPKEAQARGSGWGALQLLGALALFSFLSFMRHPDAFSYPVLYAEDGIWTGRIMTEGFWTVVVGARPDYTVAALVALEGASLLVTRFLFQSDISALPQVVAVMASVFLGFVATLPLVTLRDRLHPAYCWLIGLAIALVPVGDGGFEIFGRILNLGFYMPVIAQFVLFALLYKRLSALKTVLLQAAALFLMWSFPVVIGQYLVFIVFDAFMRKGNGTPVVVPLAAHVAVFVLGTLSLDPALLASPGGVPLPFDPGALVEFAIARATIFPVVAAIYGDLTDGWTLAALALVLAVTALFVRRIGLGRIGLLDGRVFLILNFGVVWAATLVLRRGLTSLLDDYQTSWPDRYFTGVNIMFMTALMVLFLSVPSALYRRVGAAIFLALIGSWFLTQPIFRTPWTAESLGTFRDTICRAAARTEPLIASGTGAVVLLPTYPDLPDYPFKVAVPRPIFEKTAAKQCRPR